MVDLKRCSSCGEHKPRGGFHRAASERDGLNYACKACAKDRARRYRAANRDNVREANRRWRAENRERVTAQDWRRGILRQGLSIESYEAMLLSQGGLCAACRTPRPPAAGRLHVDHDHACCPGPRSCGQCVRGLLCAKCNTALGFLDDSKERVMGLVRYLGADRAVSQ